jgi:hypothetical protein
MRTAFGFLVNAFLLAGTCGAAVSVWAVSDGARVNPVSGAVLESRTDIHADYPSRDFRRRNLVWDAGSKTVSLKAGRNEFTAFQVVIESTAPVNGGGCAGGAVAERPGGDRGDERRAIQRMVCAGAEGVDRV